MIPCTCEYMHVSVREILIQCSHILSKCINQSLFNNPAFLSTHVLTHTTHQTTWLPVNWRVKGIICMDRIRTWNEQDLITRSSFFSRLLITGSSHKDFFWEAVFSFISEWKRGATISGGKDFFQSIEFPSFHFWHRVLALVSHTQPFR